MQNKLTKVNNPANKEIEYFFDKYSEPEEK